MIKVVFDYRREFLSASPPPSLGAHTSGGHVLNKLSRLSRVLEQFIFSVIKVSKTIQEEKKSFFIY